MVIDWQPQRHGVLRRILRAVAEGMALFAFFTVLTVLAALYLAAPV